MPIVGRMSDVYGRRKLFLVSSFIFAFGLLISSLSKNFNLIIVGRLIQGLGAGGILPLTNAMITDMGKGKAKGLALVNATYGLGVVTGINSGGIIYNLLGWKWMFLIPMFLLTLFSVFGIKWIRETLDVKKKEKIDYLGSILFALAVMSFMLMMKNLASVPFTDFGVYSYFLSFVFLSILFIIRELKIDHPAIDLKLFKNPGFALYNLIAFLFGFSMFIFTGFLSPYVQTLLGYDIAQSVYAIDPFALVMVIFIMIGGILIKKFGARFSMFLGSAIFAIMSYLFVMYVADVKTFFVFSILLSSGLGLSMTPMNYLVIEEGGKKNQGTSAGVVSIMRSLGGIIGPTMTGIFLSQVNFASLFAVDNILNAYNKSFMLAFYAMLLASVISIFEIIIYRKRRKII
jgi:MFS family permease